MRIINKNKNNKKKDDLDDSFLKQNVDNISLEIQSFNKKNMLIAGNNSQHIPKVNHKNQKYVNRFFNNKDKSDNNKYSCRNTDDMIIIQKDEIVEKELLLESFKNSDCHKNQRESAMSCLGAKTLFIENNIEASEKFKINKTNKNIKENLRNIKNNEVNSEQIQTNKNLIYSNNKSTNKESTDLINNNSHLRLNGVRINNNKFNYFLLAKNTSKTKLFEKLNKEQSQIPNNFCSHRSNGNKELLNYKNKTIFSIRSSFDIDNVNHILLNKLKFGEINKKQFSNIKYNSKGLLGNFEKIKLSDFNHLPYSSASNEIQTQEEFENLNIKSLFLASKKCVDKQQQTQNNLFNSDFSDKNIHSKFKNGVINKSINNDSYPNNNLIRYNSFDIISPSTLSDNSIFSKTKNNSCFYRTSLSRDKENFNLLNLNDMRISKVNLNFLNN